LTLLNDILQRNDSVRLPTPPAIALRILEVVSADEVDFNQLSRIITADPALTARVLRVANSPLFSPKANVDSIATALTRLGSLQVTNIALSFLLVQSLRAHSCHNGFDFTYFWKRSITAAVAADLIGRQCLGRNDNLFIAGLLHDIGILVAFGLVPDYAALFDGRIHRRLPLSQEEKERFGFGHCQLGAELLHSWHLPAAITEPIRHHHQPDTAPADWRDAALAIQLGDRIAAVLHGKPAGPKLQALRETLQQQGLAENDIDRLLQQIFRNSVRTLSFFEIPADQMKTAEELLQEANQHLSQLNLCKRQLLDDARLQQQDLLRQTERLHAVNTELSRLAFQDSLTGLYNLRYFHDHFDRELARAARYGNHFSLILLDLDEFKQVNDRHGHQAGDLVLQQIARVASLSLRDTDLLVRYGGEEFAVLLPQTDLAEAEVTAERLRRHIAACRCPWQGQELQVTASIGLVHSSATADKNRLIQLADHAMYRAKTEGKNRVCRARPATAS